MSGRRAVAAAFAVALAALDERATARAQAADPAAQAAPGAPLTLRAELVLEPGRIALGDVAVLEQIVVTPPGLSVRPASPPEAPDGLWLLGSETLPVEREPQRWVHRTRLRIRARDVGAFAWPPAPLLLEAEDGRRESLTVPGKLVEVVSVLSELESRETPFGLRGLPGLRARPGGALVPALAGAMFTLATLGLVALVRRERRRRSAADAPGAAGPLPDPGPPPDVEASECLAAADGEADPHRAADLASFALRRFVSRRFLLPALAATTQELSAARPAFAGETRWESLVELLQQLDDVRFRPASAGNAEAVRRSLVLARSFVGGAAKPDA